MTVFKLVRFSRLLKMNWHFVAKAILGKNAPSLWIIFVTYRVRITTSPLKFGGFFMSPHFLNFPCTSQRLRRASAGVRGSDAMEHAFRQGQQIFQQQTGNFVGEPLKSQQSLGQEAGGDVIIYIYVEYWSCMWIDGWYNLSWIRIRFFPVQGQGSSNSELPMIMALGGMHNVRVPQILNTLIM